MRRSLLCAAVLAAGACRPPGGVEPARPVTREVLAPVDPPGPVTAPEPPPVPAPAPTWAWALGVLPELAEHSEVDASEAALAYFLANWFKEGETARVHVLLDRCHAVRGIASADGFHGEWRREVTIRGDERRVSAMDLFIHRGGISETGPGGSVSYRDGRGGWREGGMFGTGYFGTLVDHPMSAADDHQVTFAGYSYQLTPECRSRETIDQTCIGGGKRSCERCTHIGLRPHADHMTWKTGSIGIGTVEPVPVDCTRACPVDAWTPLLPRLTAVLAGRTFVGALPGQGPTVFRRAKGCNRELRWRHAAAAAQRRAERAEATK